MRKRYPAILFGTILLFGVLTGCGGNRTVQQPHQADSVSSEREAELQAEIDALQQELDAMKDAQNQKLQNADSSTNADDNTNAGDNSNTGSSTNNGNASELAISMEEAQNIALERVPGATAQDMSIELDHDDGWYIYEGDILYNRMEYEFEIDANTGNILKWEEERW